MKHHLRAVGYGGLLLFSLTGRSPATELLVVGQPALSGTVSATAENGSIVFDVADAEPRNVPPAELVRWGHPRSIEHGTIIVGIDRSLLIVEAAEVIKADQDRLEVQSIQYGPLLLPIDQLAGIIFRPPAAAVDRWRLIDGMFEATATSDRAMLANGDRLRGVMQGMNSRTVQFDAEIGALDVARRELVALAFNPQLSNPPSDDEPRLWVGLDDGSRLRARDIEIDSSHLTVQCGDDLAIPTDLEALVWLQSESPQARCLSDLEPLGYRHVPYLTLEWPYARDRNLRGGPLAAGDELYAKGIAMHSAARLSYRVPAGFTRFRATVAIDGHCGARGSVVCRVYVDEDLRYTSPMVRGGDAPLAVDVDLRDGSSVSLLVAFGDRGDVGDHADWLDARFEP